MSLTESPNQKKALLDLLSGNEQGALQSIYNLFNEVPFAVAVLKGNDLIIDYINQYNLDVWQQKKEEVIGKPLFVARPDFRERVETIHRGIYKTGKRFTAKEIPIDITVNNKTETRYFDAVIDPIFDDNGKIVGQLATSIEVTDKVVARKKIEESEALLRKTKEQLELSISAGKIGIWHWDVKNNVLTWSKEQLEIFGVEKNEFNGEAEDFFKYIIEEDKEKIKAASRMEFERFPGGNGHV